MKHRLGSIPLAVLTIVSLTAVDLSVREDEIECEQAVSHLANCCPDFVRSSVNCQYEGCSLRPDLEVSESQCITALDCDEVIQRGLCVTVPAIDRSQHQQQGSADGGKSALVCQ